MNGLRRSRCGAFELNVWPPGFRSGQHVRNHMIHKIRLRQVRTHKLQPRSEIPTKVLFLCYRSDVSTMEVTESDEFKTQGEKFVFR